GVDVLISRPPPRTARGPLTRTRARLWEASSSVCGRASGAWSHPVRLSPLTVPPSRCNGEALVRPEASMGKLIYAANSSLDGYVEDVTGSFDWSVPDEEVHAFWNEHERGIGTSLYGRRMYETMRVWEDDDWLADEPTVVREYAQIWRDADKVVYSSTLEDVTTARRSEEHTSE